MASNPFPVVADAHGSRTGPTIVAAGSDERPRRSECVRDQLLADGSMVLYHTCRQEIMTLNPTAAFIWECCDGARSVALIADELRAVFPDVPGISADILPLLRELLDRGMIADDCL